MPTPLTSTAGANARTSLYFLVQFMSGGAFHAYAGIWFASLGFSPNQIAALSSVPTAAILMITIFSGQLADRARDWRQALYMASGVSFLGACGLLLSQHYIAVLFFWSLSIIAQTLTVPIGDGAALYLTRNGRGEIGTFRALSTLGYIVALFLTGIVIQRLGGTYYAALFTGLCGFRYAAAFLMPDFKTQRDQENTISKFHLFVLLKQYWLMLPLAAWATAYSTILVLNSFLSLTLQEQGYGEASISYLIAIGALAEATVFYLFRRFSHCFDLRHMILLSCVVTTLRWIAMTFAPGFPLLVLLQASHGICFGLGFIACITYVSRNTPAENAAEAQSLFTVMQMITSIITVSLFGMLSAAYGVQAYWGLAAVAALSALMSYWSLKFNKPSS